MMQGGNRIRGAAALICLLLIVASCGDDDPAAITDTAPAVTTTAEPAAPGPVESFPPGGTIDFSLRRKDVKCTQAALGGDDAIEFTTAHFVVEGNLGAPCLGEEDATLTRAWELLAAIVPGGQLNDLGLFGGFADWSGEDEVTLAFVTTIDNGGDLYQMSVNLETAQDDPNELILTMAHEFSHVFTALPFELDRFADPDTCTTYFNGDGCYAEDSLMAEWIATFWGDGLIDEIDPDEDPSGDLGQQRCDLNPGFLGAYAASNPEEDFAESFSAFVFRLPVGSPELETKMDWFARQPGLLEFRDRADAANLGPVENNFDECGAAA